MTSGERGGAPRAGERAVERYAALDLGTNNCRLLIAAPSGRTLRIVDSFSRIVRLGEGLSGAGVLSDAAMARTIEALRECAAKIARRGVTHQRCIATEACRAAANGAEFLKAVHAETGLEFDIITTEEEARLALRGCADLLDPGARAGLILDIGGGSTELSLARPNPAPEKPDLIAWTSLPYGVVSLAEKWGGREISAETYEKIVDEVAEGLSRFGDPGAMKPHFAGGDAHLLGTSGTVTSIAGVHLGLARYRRDRIDGLWMTVADARAVAEKLRNMTFDQRAAEPCIGRDRADLVVCGCAILEAVARAWPATRLRVGDRGLREGVLAELAEGARRARRRRRRNRKRGPR